MKHYFRLEKILNIIPCMGRCLQNQRFRVLSKRRPLLLRNKKRLMPQRFRVQCCCAWSVFRSGLRWVHLKRAALRLFLVAMQ